MRLAPTHSLTKHTLRVRSQREPHRSALALAALPELVFAVIRAVSPHQLKLKVPIALLYLVIPLTGTLLDSPATDSVFLCEECACEPSKSCLFGESSETFTLDCIW